jgi:hypothetical protein
MKGLTLTNLIALVLSFIIYMTLIPILNPMIDICVASMMTSPNSMTDATVAIIRLVPFIFIVAIVLTAINYTKPRPYEGNPY